MFSGKDTARSILLNLIRKTIPRTANQPLCHHTLRIDSWFMHKPNEVCEPWLNVHITWQTESKDFPELWGSCYLKTQLSKDIFDADIKIQKIYNIQDLENVWALKKKNNPPDPPCYYMWPKVFSLRYYTPEMVLPTRKGIKATETRKPDCWSVMLSEKILIKGYKCKKNNNK